MNATRRKLKQLNALDKKLRQLPPPTPVERDLVDAELRFDAVYHSNRLEGNKLSRAEARKAVAAA